MNETTAWLFGGLLAVLAVATAIGEILRRKVGDGAGKATVSNLNARIKSWWLMCAVFVMALFTGGIGSVVLFGLISFLALREFITLTPTRPADHRTLFWVFFVITPLQYLLVGVQWYGLFIVMIPVFAFLFIPTRSALAGDPHRFLDRTARIQWALMICVYCVSHAPALMSLKIPGFEGQNANLLFFMVVVVQLSDVLQYIFGQWLGKRKIAPTISPNKTWEGFLGGVLGATAVGTGLWWATPFSPWQAAGMSLAITLAGFAGGLTLSAVKRDRGVKDYGTLIAGHGGILDRIDSLCFAAPLFFHLTHRWFT